MKKDYVVTIARNGDFKAIKVQADGTKELKEKYGKDFVSATLIGRATERSTIEAYILNILAENGDELAEPIENVVDEWEKKIRELRKDVRQVNVIYREGDRLFEMVSTTDFDFEEEAKKNGLEYVTTYNSQKLPLSDLLPKVRIPFSLK